MIKRERTSWGKGRKELSKYMYTEYEGEEWERTRETMGKGEGG